MGSYNTPEHRLHKYDGSFSTAVREFGSSLIGAREIEMLDLKKISLERKLPMAFYIANKTLDNAIEELREMNPDLCPRPLKQ